MKDWFRRALIRLRDLGPTARAEREFDDEVQEHLSLLADRFARQGMSPDEAMRAARRRFGNATLLKEMRLDLTRFVGIEALWRDLRYGVRSLRRNAGFTTAALLLLALGIGSTTAIFGVLDELLLRPLPVPSPGELAVLRLEISPQATFQGAARLGFVSVREFLGPDPGFPRVVYDRLRASNQVFADILAEAPQGSIDLADGSSPGDLDPVRAEFVTGSYFRVLGVDPALGRVLSESDDRPAGAEGAVAVISRRLWQRRFGLDPSILGRSVRLNAVPVTIVGVAAERFDGTSAGTPTGVWVSSRLRRAVSPNAQGGLIIIGRLKPHVTLAEAQAGVRAVLPALRLGEAFEFPTADSSWFDVIVADGRTGLSSLRARYAEPLTIAMCVAAVVLLIACANLATLLLARATARRRETAVRLSLGAGRARVVRQLFLEHLVLATVGGAAGLMVAQLGGSLLAPLVYGDSPEPVTTAHTNGRILAFAAMVTVLSALLSGLAPAIRATRLTRDRRLTAGSDVLRSSSDSGRATGRLLIPAQVAASLVLLVCGLLLVRTLRNLDALDIGLDKSRVLLVQFDLGNAGYQGARLAGFADDLEAHLRSLPGVVSTSVVTSPPLGGPPGSTRIQVTGYSPPSTAPYFTAMSSVGPGFFRTSGIRILRGREFTGDDREAGGAVTESAAAARRPGVAIVNESFVRSFLGGKDPLGAEFTASRVPLTVVGIARDAHYESLRVAPAPMVYVPVAQDLSRLRRLALLVRFGGTPGEVVPLRSAIRAEVRRASGIVRVTRIETLETLVDRSIVDERLAADVSGLAGALALLLVSVGLFGAVLYRVTRRTRELGIRLALGARRAGIFRVVIAETMTLVLAGVAVGLPLALAGGTFISARLFGVGATDPATLLGAAGLMVAVALLAGCGPAYRATRVDPVIALRYE